MTGKEKELIDEAFDTNWIAPLGPHVNAFEKELSAYVGTGFAAVTSSGTAALHLALILLGVEKDDEVICQSFTFCGSVNPVVYAGGIPVLVDSEPTTWNIDPGLLEKAIKDRISKGKKPKAIIYVHLYGMPAKVDEILSIARHYEIPVIEDAAEALGARYKNERVGKFGDISILSFNGNKIITTGGGGALLSGNENYIKKARFLATQARDPAPHYEHSELGYNYRMSNVLAAIGRGQLQEIENFIKARRKILEFYKSSLSGQEGIRFQEEPGIATGNRWLTCMLIDPEKTGGPDRESIRLALEKENIESRPFWKPMHLQPLYKNAPYYGNGISEKLFEQGLCLPSGSAMTEEDLERVVEVIKRCVKLY